jgi:hypothetical protein
LKLGFTLSLLVVKENRRLVRALNAELSRIRKVVFRTPGKKFFGKDAYTLLDVDSGERCYLSFVEVSEMAAKVKNSKSELNGGVLV